ncbi:MAG: PAS domain-containing protein [Clostridia bacterium]|nr:PAS domain-containing protein [Clostridia bacterium]
MNRKIFGSGFLIAAVVLAVSVVCIAIGMLDYCSPMQILSAIVQPLIFVILLTLIFTAMVSQRTVNSIIRHINEIEPEKPLENVSFEELMPLLKKLDMQNRRLEKQLKRAERTNGEFKVITENMSEGFLIVDRKMNLLTCNKSALSLLGLEKSEKLSLHKLNHSEGFRRALETALSGKRAEEEMTLNEHYYSLIANPVLREGFVKGAVVVILDVTESVEREKLRSEFTSNVSHELKTPLTSVSGFAEIMKDGKTPPETVADFSASIYDEAQRLISLVNDIIKISELDERSVHFVNEKVDLHKLAGEVIERLSPSAEKKNVTVTLSGERVVIVGVHKILDEMIHNLCDNAIKYNKDGGRAEVRVFWDGNLAKISVSDTGIGIPAASQARVFERFYRVDKSHSKAIGGTGLGLSIVKHGAMYHNAKIDLKSTEGEGTTITITFETE